MQNTVEPGNIAMAANVIVKPQTVHIGAEISAVDLRQALTPAEVAALRPAGLESYLLP